MMTWYFCCLKASNDSGHSDWSVTKQEVTLLFEYIWWTTMLRSILSLFYYELLWGLIVIFQRGSFSLMDLSMSLFAASKWITTSHYKGKARYLQAQLHVITSTSQYKWKSKLLVDSKKNQGVIQWGGRGAIPPYHFREIYAQVYAWTNNSTVSDIYFFTWSFTRQIVPTVHSYQVLDKEYKFSHTQSYIAS